MESEMRVECEEEDEALANGASCAEDTCGQSTSMLAPIGVAIY